MVDLAVYHHNRAFRVILSAKLTDPHPAPFILDKLATTQVLEAAAVFRETLVHPIIDDSSPHTSFARLLHAPAPAPGASSADVVIDRRTSPSAALQRAVWAWKAAAVATVDPTAILTARR